MEDNLAEKLPSLQPAARGGSLAGIIIGEDLYEQFRNHCLHDPDRVAIYNDSEVFTYRECDEQIAVIAGRLRELGVQEQDKVVIRIPRSPAFVMSVFAVMAVGGVFVPVSEGFPVQRVREVIAKVNAVVLIEVESSTLTVTAELTGIERTRTLNEAGLALAYILHTSGSTGSPKGVAVPRKALANCLSWHAELFGVTHDVCFSHLNLTSFDFIIAEVILPLVVGGNMAIPSASVSTDVANMIKALGFAKVEVIQMVPTLMDRFLRALTTSSRLRAQLRTFADGGRMICNGEALPDSTRRRFYRLFPHAQLYNCYGPTEACVAVTSYLCLPADEPKPMYIGRVVPNTDLYIVTEQLEAVPQGVSGELLIGGVQVAVGYVADPDETTRKFLAVDTPSGPQRLYRTGDVVRMSPTGLLEFVGRDDRQVKYRGLRLELGEIESAAQCVASVNQAKALVTEPSESRGRQQLILFVTPSSINIRALKEFLTAELPADRQPSLIVALEVFPATDRGKLDRDALIQLALSPSGEHQKMKPDRRNRSDDHVEILLSAIRETTGRDYLADDLWPVAGMDSMGLLDLELGLLSEGYAFISHACERHGITLRALSEELRRDELTEPDAASAE